MDRSGRRLDLLLVEDRRIWQPFDGQFNHSRWSTPNRYGPAYSVRDGQVEVARVQLDEGGLRNGDYVDAPRLGPGSGALLIAQLEVALSWQHTGVGTSTVRELEQLVKGRRLIALAGDQVAEEFWSSLGWTRHDHVEGRGSAYMSLFVQPLRR